MPIVPPHVARALEAPYPLAATQIAFFREHGFIKLKDVVPSDALAFTERVVTAEVERRTSDIPPLDQRDTYGKAFLQIMNIWQHSEEARAIVFSRRLARLATDLLEVEGVRLYHDQALYKEAGGGHTPWHADQYYWPLASDRTVTAWIPLQSTPLDMGPLEFSGSSHRLVTGRNMKISDESELALGQRLTDAAFRRVVEPFDPGEVSFHLGWLFHRAGPNVTGKARKVMTVIYMDKDITLKAPENDNQAADWTAWCPGAEVGKIIATPLNPVLFEY